MKQANILIVGGNSQIAKHFLKTTKPWEKCFVTVRTKHDKHTTVEFVLDLENKGSIIQFLKATKRVHFTSVIFFASSYVAMTTPFEMKNIRDHMNVHLFGPFELLSKLKLNKGATILFLTDAGTVQPKPNFLGYSFSKAVLREFIRHLAVEFAPSVRIIGLDVGPILTRKTGLEKTQFLKKALLTDTHAILGLMTLIRFVIHEQHLFMTGSVIPFDGGTYLKRPTGHETSRMV